MSKCLCPFCICSPWGCSMLNFFFLWIIFSHYGRDVLFTNLQCMPLKSNSLYFKIFQRVLALRRICLHWWKDISVLAVTLHLLEGKYYPLLSWKIQQCIFHQSEALWRFLSLYHKDVSSGKCTDCTNEYVHTSEKIFLFPP